ncbi:MAG: ABC transporter permease [Roseburia sp.]|nr:ABC transporter permease [Roseburia sp.]
MIAVLKHELRNYFHSLTAYLFCAFLLVFVGIGAMLYNIQSAVANFELVLSFVCIGMVVIVPVLTMRVISEEKKQKTDQLLYALPLKTSQIIIGKYLALLIIFLIPMCIISTYPLIFAQFGEVYLLTSYGSLLAFFIMGSAMIAIGTFISSLTENQGFAAGIAIPVLLFNYYSVTLAEYVSSTAFGSLVALCVVWIILAFLVNTLTKNDNLAFGIGIAGVMITAIVYRLDSTLFEGLLPKIMSQLSLFDRFYDFVDGVFDITSIVFYVTVIIFFLFLSVQSLEKRRYN